MFSQAACVFLTVLLAAADNIGCTEFSSSVEEGLCGRTPTPREIGNAVGVAPCGDIDKPCFVRQRKTVPDDDDCHECVRIQSGTTVIYGQVLGVQSGPAEYEINVEAFTRLQGTAPPSCATAEPIVATVTESECYIMAGCRRLDTENGTGTCGTFETKDITMCGFDDDNPCVVAMQDATSGKNHCTECYEIKSGVSEFHVKVIAAQNGLQAADPWQMQLPGWLWNTMTGQPADCTNFTPRVIQIDQDDCERTPTPPSGTKIGCRVFTSAEEPGCSRSPTAREIGGQTLTTNCGTADKPCFVKKVVKYDSTPDTDDCGDCVNIRVGSNSIHGIILSTIASTESTETQDYYELNAEGFTVLNGGNVPTDCAAAARLTASRVVDEECKITVDCRQLAAGSATCENILATDLTNCGTDDDYPCVVAMQDATLGANQCGKCFELKYGNREFHVKVKAAQDGTAADDPWQMQLPGWLWNRMTGQNAACTGASATVIQYDDEDCSAGGSPPTGSGVGCAPLSTDTEEATCGRTPTTREVGDAGIDACGTVEKPCFVRKYISSSDSIDADDCGECVVLRVGVYTIHGQILSIQKSSTAQVYYEVNKEAYTILNGGMEPSTCATTTDKLAPLSVVEEDCRITTNCRVLAAGNGECGTIEASGLTNCGFEDESPCVVAMQDATSGKNQCAKCYEIKPLVGGADWHVKVMTSQDGSASADPWQMQLPGWLWNRVTGQADTCTGATAAVLEIEDEDCETAVPPGNIGIGCKVFTSVQEPACLRTPTAREIGNAAGISPCGDVDKPCFVKKVVRAGTAVDVDDCGECIMIVVGTKTLYGQILSAETGRSTSTYYEVNEEAYTQLNGNVAPVSCALATKLHATTVTELDDCSISVDCRMLAPGPATCGTIGASDITNCGTEARPCVVAMQDAVLGKNQCSKCYEIKKGEREWHIKVMAAQDGTAVDDPWQMQLPGWLFNAVTGGSATCAGSTTPEILKYDDEECEGGGTLPPSSIGIKCAVFTAVPEPTCGRTPTTREIGGDTNITPCGTTPERPCFIRKTARMGGMDRDDCYDCVRFVSSGRTLYGEILSIVQGAGAVDSYEVNLEGYTILNGGAPSAACASAPSLSLSVVDDDQDCRIAAGCRVLVAGEGTCGTIPGSGLTNCGGESNPCIVAMQDAEKGKNQCDKCYEVQALAGGEDYHVKVMAAQDGTGPLAPWQMQLPGWLWNQVTGGSDTCAAATTTVLEIEEEYCEGGSVPPGQIPVRCRTFTEASEPGCGRYPTPREIGGQAGITSCGATRDKPCFVRKTAKLNDWEQDDCGDCVHITYGTRTLYGQILSNVAGTDTRDSYEINLEAYTYLAGSAPTSCAAAPVLGVTEVDDEDCYLTMGCRKLADELGPATCAQIIAEDVQNCGTELNPCVVAMQDATWGKNQCDKCYEIEVADVDYHVRVIASQNGVGPDDPWQMQLPGWLWNKLTTQAVDCTGMIRRDFQLDEERCQGTPPPVVSSTEAPPTNLQIRCKVFAAVAEPGCSRTPTAREIGGQAGIDGCGTVEKPCFVKKVLKAGSVVDGDDCGDCIKIVVGTNTLHGQIHSISIGTAAADSYEINSEGYTILSGSAPTDCALATPLTSTSVADEACQIVTNCRNLAGEVGTSVCGSFTDNDVRNCGDSEISRCVIAMQDATAGQNQCDKCYEITSGTSQYHVKVTTAQNGGASADPWQMQLPGYLWNRVTGQSEDCVGADARTLVYEDEDCDSGGVPPTAAQVGCTVLSTTEAAAGCARRPTTREAGNAAGVSPCGTEDKPCFARKLVAAGNSVGDDCHDCLRIVVNSVTIYAQILSQAVGTHATGVIYELNQEAYTLANGGSPPTQCADATKLVATAAEVECKISADCAILSTGSGECADIGSADLTDCGHDDDHPCVVRMQDAANGLNQCDDCFEVKYGSASLHVRVKDKAIGVGDDLTWKMQLPGWAWNKLTGQAATCAAATTSVLQYETEVCGRPGAAHRDGALVAIVLALAIRW